MTGKWNYVLGVVIAVLLVAVLAVQLTGATVSRATQPAATADPATGPTRSITVVGEGSVSAKPNIAHANIGVESTAPTVAEATSENNDKMTAVIAKLKDLGVAEKDIQTSNYSINPERSVGTSGPGQVTGYQVSNTVNVTIRDLSQVGPILDAVTQAGANTVYGVSFGFDNPAELQAEARAKAIADAQARADDLAKLSDIQRGEVLSISEIVGSNPVPLMRAAEAPLAAGGGTPIQPGELEVTVQIQVTYTIQ
jgi:uncharacterized protein YggE